MSEVVVTGIGPVLANCADRHTLWSQLKDGPSQLAFEPVPGGSGERWPVGRVHGFDAERWLGRFPRSAHLCSGLARNVTGEIITIDGGFSRAYL